jgi:hypothetical protein
VAPRLRKLEKTPTAKNGNPGSRLNPSVPNCYGFFGVRTVFPCFPVPAIPQTAITAMRFHENRHRIKLRAGRNLDHNVALLVPDYQAALLPLPFTWNKYYVSHLGHVVLLKKYLNNAYTVAIKQIVFT